MVVEDNHLRIAAHHHMPRGQFDFPTNQALQHDDSFDIRKYSCAIVQ
jgi:hypothetical protein